MKRLDSEPAPEEVTRIPGTVRYVSESVVDVTIDVPGCPCHIRRFDRTKFEHTGLDREYTPIDYVVRRIGDKVQSSFELGRHAQNSIIPHHADGSDEGDFSIFEGFTPNGN